MLAELGPKQSLSCGTPQSVFHLGVSQEGNEGKAPLQNPLIQKTSPDLLMKFWGWTNLKVTEKLILFLGRLDDFTNYLNKKNLFFTLIKEYRYW